MSTDPDNDLTLSEQAFFSFIPQSFIYFTTGQGWKKNVLRDITVSKTQVNLAFLLENCQTEF